MSVINYGILWKVMLPRKDHPKPKKNVRAIYSRWGTQLDLDEYHINSELI